MTRLSILSATTASLALMAGSVLADVTAEDVKANYEAMVTALGGELTSTEERTGEALVLKDMRFTFSLPEGVGTAEISMPELTLTEKGGAVELRYPAEAPLRMSFDSEEGSAIAELTMRAPDYLLLAKGDPDDITYTYDIEKMDVIIDKIEMSGFDSKSADGVDPATSITGIMNILGSAGTMRIMTGDGFQMDASQKYDSMTYEVTTVDSSGSADVKSVQKNTAEDMSFEGTYSVPATGVSIMNLSQGLKDGLAINFVVEAGNVFQDMTATKGDDVIMRQKISQERQSQRFAAAQDAIKISGTSSGLVFEMSEMPGMPMPVSFSVEELGMGATVPVVAGEEAKEGVVDLALSGIEMADEIWSMFDPEMVLPRDPANIKLRFSGEYQQAFDLLNFNRWAAFKDGDTSPVVFDTARLQEFEVEAVGAKVAAEGAFTLDNADMTTFPGMPRPDGSVSLNASGVNGLIDNLVKIGLVPEDQVMGFRMMLGMFTKPGDSEDTLTSEIKVENGQVFANGQRLR